jgi:hypothetical protein
MSENTTNPSYPFGRGESGTLNKLKNPKEYHYTDVGYKEARKCTNFNTVGNREMISKDVQRIKNNEAEAKTIDRKGGQSTNFILDKDRTYGVGHSGTLYPRAGSGLHQLNQKQTRALGTINDDFKKSPDKLKGKISQDDANLACKIWQQDKGKDADPKDVKDWQKEIAQKLSKDNDNDRKRGR